MDKAKRQEQLLEIISKIEVNTQEELIKILEAQGLKVTQATISRDIKELGLVKTAGKSKKYCYSQAKDKQRDANKLLGLFRVAVSTITVAQNLVVLKTLTGNGSAVAATIDARGFAEIVGTLAGDDTVLVVTGDNEAAARVANELTSLLK
ncbi:MAG: arginine repressor [Clostridia bacterium]|nr:arginine repressor [Clostridia bacterium]